MCSDFNDLVVVIAVVAVAVGQKRRTTFFIGTNNGRIK